LEGISRLGWIKSFQLESRRRRQYRSPPGVPVISDGGPEQLIGRFGTASRKLLHQAGYLLPPIGFAFGFPIGSAARN
jgi:hypothetical protein